MIINTNSSQTDLQFHIVWVTKYRKHAFDTNMQNQLKDKIEQIAKDNESSVIALEVMLNHVHLLVQLSPKISLTSFVKKVKGITAKWLFQEYPDLRNKFWKHHLWSSSYFAKTVGNCSQQTIEHYINTQWERPYR